MKESFLHFILVVSNAMMIDVAGVVAPVFLPVLPYKDSCPGQDAGNKPPRGAEDQEKEKDSGEECQDARFYHGLLLNPNKITYNIE